MCGEFDVVHMNLVHPNCGIADTLGNVMLQDCFCHITKMCLALFLAKAIAVLVIDVCFMSYANAIMIHKLQFIVQL